MKRHCTKPYSPVKLLIQSQEVKSLIWRLLSEFDGFYHFVSRHNNRNSGNIILCYESNQLNVKEIFDRKGKTYNNFDPFQWKWHCEKFNPLDGISLNRNAFIIFYGFPLMALWMCHALARVRACAMVHLQIEQSMWAISNVILWIGWSLRKIYSYNEWKI